MYIVERECDSANVVLVGRPLLSIIEECNNDLKRALYKEPVNTNLMLEQHNNLLDKLLSHNLLVYDITQDSDILTKNLDPLSLANIVFTRDPVITTANGIVLGRFRERVRNKEVDILKDFLDKNAIEIKGQIEYPGCVEGGDFFAINENLCMIAIGMRTNFEGVYQMIEKDLFGTENVAVVKYSGNETNMHCIHLDCYFGIVGPNTVLLWEGAKDFFVDEYQCEHLQKSRFNVKFVNVRDMPLMEYLECRCKFRVILVSTQSQVRYGCNVLMINDKTVLTQERQVTEQLNMHLPELKTIYVELSEIHKMYGGIRCATQVISRTTLFPKIY